MAVLELLHSALLCAEAAVAAVALLLLIVGYLPIQWMRERGNGDRLQLLEEHRERVAKIRRRATAAAAAAADETTDGVRAPSLAMISKKEFDDAVRRTGAQWCVVEHVVVDLARFKSHPGGPFLANFVGRDATPWFLIAHSKSAKAMRMVRALAVGVLECECFDRLAWGASGDKDAPPYAAGGSERGGGVGGASGSVATMAQGVACTHSPLLQHEDNAYLQMRESFRERGAFENTFAWMCIDIGEVYFPTAFGLWLYHSGTAPALAVAITTLGAIRQGMLFHDIGHFSVFRSAATGQAFNRWFSIVVWALDFHKPTAIHQIHHAFVNVVGLDTALEMGPIVTHPAMTGADLEAADQIAGGDNAAADRSPEAAKSDKPAKASLNDGAKGNGEGARAPSHMGVLQNVLFYALLIWLVWPYYVVAAVLGAAHDRDWLLMTAVSVRFALCVVFWDFFYPLCVATVIGFAYFAVTGSLNHFHKTMRTRDEVFGELDRYVSFVELQSDSVQNTHSNALTDWLLGHFTLHIEHHLFPMLPRRRYNELHAEVKRLVTDAGPFYSVCTQGDAISAFNAKLRKPF